MMVFCMHRQQDDFRFGRGLQDGSSGINAIQEGHIEIEQGDVRAELSGQPDRFSTVGGFSHNGETLPLYQELQTLTNDGMVIGHQDVQ
jgi:hypothetical protein